MTRRLIGSVVGALATVAVAAPGAHGAGAPAKVTVRAEAPGKTLVTRTVTTTTAPVVKDGNAAHACTGTSVAGALELATGGKWKGSWFSGLGYAVDAILGVEAPADFSAYWTLWVNGRPSTTGICDTELERGDEVLEFLCAPTPDFASCTNLPLAIEAGRVRMERVTVKVVRLKGDGTSEPVAGATVRGGLQPVTTGADGRARVTLLHPDTTLRATHDGDVPSAPLHCALGDGGGGCGSRDGVRPVVRLRTIANGQAIAAADAPRVLRGVARDRGGIADVALRLTRRLGDRCWRFDATREAFRRCGTGPIAPFSIGDRARWSYLLPGRLPAGAYTLVVKATDDAGNRTTLRVRFTVLG